MEMKKAMRSVQVVSLVVMALSVLAGLLIPAAYYLAAGAMIVLAIAALAEPDKAPACPMIFSRSYQEQFSHKAA